MDTTISLVDLLKNIIPVAGALIAALFGVAAAIYGVLKQRGEGAKFEAKLREAAAAARHAIPGPPQLSEQQYVLIQEYHAQGIAQSKTSFWFSLIFASLGFSVIMLGVVLFLSGEASEASIATMQKPAFTLISGTVIDAVAALFFVQSNRARQLMSEFFDKLRVDRKLDECLKLANDIDDPKIQSSLKAVLALSFAEVGSASQMLPSVLGSSNAPTGSPSVVAASAAREAVVPFDGTNAASASR
jgi:hypothetical protein